MADGLEPWIVRGNKERFSVVQVCHGGQVSTNRRDGSESLGRVARAGRGADAGARRLSGDRDARAVLPLADRSLAKQEHELSAAAQATLRFSFRKAFGSICGRSSDGNGIELIVGC